METLGRPHWTIYEQGFDALQVADSWVVWYSGLSDGDLAEICMPLPCVHYGVLSFASSTLHRTHKENVTMAPKRKVNSLSQEGNIGR